MPTSNIDELLMGGKTPQHPQTPEITDSQKEAKQEDQPEDPSYDYGFEEEPEPEESELHETEATDDESETEEPQTDEYGNEKEQISKIVQERLARKDKQHQREIQQRESEINELRAKLAAQGVSPEIQKAAKDFEYDPNAEGDWLGQLTTVIEKTVKNMEYKEQESRHREEEAKTQQEFRTKFQTGMEKFNDFIDVMESLPCEVTPAMTMGMRSMSDPAAFIYAAAKRQPKELERISKLRDPYAQITEMGRLEERMRRNKPTTNAPRPMGRTVEDANVPISKKKKEDTIEDLIAKSEASRLAKRNKINQSRMGRR